MTIISRSGIIAADIILIIVTWISLFRKDTKLSLTYGRATLAEVLLRDGKCFSCWFYSPIISRFLQGLFTSCPSSCCMRCIVLFRSFASKRSVLMVLNVLHLTFSLASVSNFLRPVYTHADLEMVQVAIPALQNSSYMTAFTDP